MSGLLFDGLNFLHDAFLVKVTLIVEHNLWTNLGLVSYIKSAYHTKMKCFKRLFSAQVSILNGSLETMKTFIGEQVGHNLVTS